MAKCKCKDKTKCCQKCKTRNKKNKRSQYNCRTDNATCSYQDASSEPLNHINFVDNTTGSSKNDFQSVGSSVSEQSFSHWTNLPQSSFHDDPDCICLYCCKRNSFKDSIDEVDSIGSVEYIENETLETTIYDATLEEISLSRSQITVEDSLGFIYEITLRKVDEGEVDEDMPSMRNKNEQSKGHDTLERFDVHGNNRTEDFLQSRKSRELINSDGQLRTQPGFEVSDISRSELTDILGTLNNSYWQSTKSKKNKTHKVQSQTGLSKMEDSKVSDFNAPHISHVSVGKPGISDEEFSHLPRAEERPREKPGNEKYGFVTSSRTDLTDAGTSGARVAKSPQDMERSDLATSAAVDSLKQGEPKMPRARRPRAPKSRQDTQRSGLSTSSKDEPKTTRPPRQRPLKSRVAETPDGVYYSNIALAKVIKQAGYDELPDQSKVPVRTPKPPRPRVIESQVMDASGSSSQDLSKTLKSHSQKSHSKSDFALDFAALFKEVDKERNQFIHDHPEILNKSMDAKIKSAEKIGKFEKYKVGSKDEGETSAHVETYRAKSAEGDKLNKQEDEATATVKEHEKPGTSQMRSPAKAVGARGPVDVDTNFLTVIREYLCMKGRRKTILKHKRYYVAVAAVKVKKRRAMGWVTLLDKMPF